MPAGQPFTALCQLAARGPHAGRADLHVHTTHSDGTYTPAQVVDLARRAGLSALAVTDHDTLAAVPLLRAAAGPDLEIVPGVEITAEYRARELHLLAYFVRTEDGPLTAALEAIRRHRVERFGEMVERLRRRGVSIQEEDVRPPEASDAPGRRHLAELLVRNRAGGHAARSLRALPRRRGRYPGPQEAPAGGRGGRPGARYGRRCGLGPPAL
jgi:hypothetical protein